MGGPVSIRVTAGPVGTAASRSRAEEVQRLRGEQVDAVRKAADKWRTALAGVVALITAVAVIKGRDSVLLVQQPYRIAVGVCVLAALACAAVGSFWGMRAAYGMPRLVVLRRSGGPGTHATAAPELVEAAGAVIDLRRTIVCTYLTLGLLTAAVGLTWYGPASPPAFATVTSTDGVRQCGILVSADRNRVIVKSGFQVTTVPTSHLVGITLQTGC